MNIIAVSRVFMIEVNHDIQLKNRTIWMNFGLLDYKHNMMEIKTKSCGNKMIYNVNELTACYLNHCSKIVDHGKMSSSSDVSLYYIREGRRITFIFN